MEYQLRAYIERLFAGAPQTAETRELSEEIIRNTIERYHDVLAEGRSEQEAYERAIEGIGDVSTLIREMGGAMPEPITVPPAYAPEAVAAAQRKAKTLRAVAVGLYIMCVTPVILLSNTPFVAVSPVLMFFMLSIATGLLIYASLAKYADLEPEKSASIKKRALLRAVAVGLFISCATPCILLAETPLVGISPVLLFAMIALGVVLIILSRGERSTVSRRDLKAVPPYRQKRNPLYIVITILLWLFAALGFCTLAVLRPGFLVAAWLVFPLAGALQGLASAIFDYKEAQS